MVCKTLSMIFLQNNPAELTLRPQIKLRLHLDPLISKTYSKDTKGLTEALCTMHSSQMQGFAMPPMEVDGGGRSRTAQEEGCPCCSAEKSLGLLALEAPWSSAHWQSPGMTIGL